MTQYLSFDDILNDLMLEEDKPSHEALVRWQERYPQFRQALADFFETWADQEARSHVPMPDIDEERVVQRGVEYAMEILRKQGRILPDGPPPALEPYDQLVLAAIYMLHGQANPASITERIGEISGKRGLLGSVIVSLDRLEKNHLILSREVEEEDEVRRYFTVTLRGEKALAYAKETSTVVARFLADFA
jgi:DNA-binding MarR family transcriptional regulator